MNYLHKPDHVYLPTTNHSTGGLYSMARNYCFCHFDDAGKLMGLAPYGNKDAYKEQLFELKDGNVWVNEEVMHKYFTHPADVITRPFKKNFQYYADIARWVQDETERAIIYVFKNRLKMHPNENLRYAGGVALNAVANTRINEQSSIEKFYI